MDSGVSLFDDPTDEPEVEDRSRWVPVGITLVALVWFGAVVWSVVGTLVEGFSRASLAWFGSSGHLETTREQALETLVIAAGPPAVGFVLALLFRRRRAARTLGLITVLTTIGGLCFYLLMTWEPGP